jgi:hypothetical protein
VVGVTDRPTRAYRVVVACGLAPDAAEEAVGRATLEHVSPHVAPNGLGSSVTITTVAWSQNEAERSALEMVGGALDAVVRVVLSVAL